MNSTFYGKKKIDLEVYLFLIDPQPPVSLVPVPVILFGKPLNTN